MTEWDMDTMGWGRLEQGNYEEAEKEFRAVLEQDPLHVGALTGLGVIHLGMGDTDQAQELLETALSYAQKNLPRHKRHANMDVPDVRVYVRALFYLSVLYAEEGQWERVIDALEDVKAWDSSGLDGDVSLLLAQAYHRSGRMEEAVDAYSIASEVHSESLYSLGLVCYQVGNVREAERYWLRAVRHHPELAFLIARYPRLRALPVASIEDRQFSTNAEYVEATADLWSTQAREALDRLCLQEAASGNG